MRKIFNTTVSLKEAAHSNVLRGIVQYDTLNEVNIRISDGFQAFDYTGYTNIIFKVLKADGTTYIDSEGARVIATSPADGIVTVILAGQATAAAGLCQSLIEIYSTGKKMATARLNYEVFESLEVDEKPIVSEPEYPVLQNLVADLSALESAIEIAESNRVVAEEARANALTGYVATAVASAEAAERWARAARDIAGGDFATLSELEYHASDESHITAAERKSLIPMQSDVTYYVSPAGSDSEGDGSQEKPFREIQTAIEKLPKNLGGRGVAIHVAAGDYFKAVNVYGFYGGRQSHNDSINITGAFKEDNSEPASQILASVEVHGCNVSVFIKNIKVSSAGQVDIAMYNSKQVTLNRCVCAGSVAYGVYVYNSKCEIYDTVADNKTGAALLADGSYVMARSLRGEGNAIGVQSGGSTSGKGGLFIGYNTSVQATTKYARSNGGVIFENGMEIDTKDALADVLTKEQIRAICV